MTTSSLSAIATWEAATASDIFGAVLSGDAPWGVYDQVNSLSFGNYTDPNVIGVTRLWYQGKNIYEFDIMYDTDYFPGDIDLDTVVLHELGHAAGLGDLYNTACVSEAMYGIYDGIDLDLGAGDITGLQMLYGN